MDNGLPPHANHTHPPRLPLPKTTKDILPFPTCLQPPCNRTSPPPKPMGKQANPPSDTDFVLWYSVTITASIILLTIPIALLIFYFKKSCTFPKQKSGKLFIALFIFSLIFWLMEAAITTTNIILASDPDTAQLNAWLGVLPKIFYNISRAIMLFYFIIKSYVVFQASTYSVSKTFIWILFILTVIAFILQVFPLIGRVITDQRNKNNVYYICSGWAIDFIVSIAAMYKFIAILFALTLNNTDFNEQKIRLSSVQLKMMKTITRTTVLSIFAVISSVIFGFFFNPYPAINTNVTGNDLNVAALSDSALNAICMYLSYGFTSTQYGICCKLCDIGINRLCVWCTKKAIRKQSGKDVEQNEKISEKVHVKYSRTNGIMVENDTHQLAVPSKSSKSQYHQSIPSGSTQTNNTMNENEISENMEMTLQQSKNEPRSSVTVTEQSRIN